MLNADDKWVFCWLTHATSYAFVSLLPSRTEVLFALGIERVGVSHSCDHPPAVADIPTVTSTAINHQDDTPDGINT